MQWRSCCVLFALLLSAAVSVPASAAEQLPPAAGRFLVATRAQQGFFAKSVILLISYGPDGALGVVINHPTKLKLTSVLPDPQVMHGRGDLLYVGGPVSLDDLTMLIRADAALPESVRVLPGIYASESLATLRAAVGRKLAVSHFRAYAGYAGWGPGQLDAELAQGAWTVSPADAADVFTTAPANLWQRLSQSGTTLVVQVTRCLSERLPACGTQARALPVRSRAGYLRSLD